MVKKAYLKSTGRLFLRHIIRLLSISAIFVVTVSLISGLGDVQSNIKQSINTSYVEDNIHDVTVRSYATLVEQIKNDVVTRHDYYGVSKNVETVYTYDMYDPNNDRYAKRNIFMDFDNYKEREGKIDQLELLDGRFPDPNAANYEVVVERNTKDIAGHTIGSKISSRIQYTYDETELFDETIEATVVGIVKNPTAVSLTREPSVFFLEEGGKHLYLNDIFYFPDSIISAETKYLPLGLFPALNITLKNRSFFNCFSNDYKREVEILKTKIQDFSLSDLTITYSLMDDNYSLWMLGVYADKVGVLATIFIVFFILIAVLVVYSTMSRLLDEERSSMAVLKTLGYSNFAIAFRYLLFTLVAGLIGIGLSAIPAKIVNSLILNAFSIQYSMKAIDLPIVGPYFFILALTILLSSLILTTIKSVRTANHSPVELLTPKAPKVGKKIILERIKAIWSRLSFKYKSTYRNVFLFKARFIMTVLSIMAATVLVFASFSLLNNALKMQGFESLTTISLLLLAFSAALCALVIYNITNINISERTREIATLMVLGYRNNEVVGYVYREIYILTAIGSILGLPAGIGFVVFVFDYIGVFELANVEWWTYLVSPLLTFVFALLATRLLHLKIVKTDMNESLKVLE